MLSGRLVLQQTYCGLAFGWVLLHRTFNQYQSSIGVRMLDLAQMFVITSTDISTTSTATVIKYIRCYKLADLENLF